MNHVVSLATTSSGFLVVNGTLCAQVSNCYKQAAEKGLSFQMASHANWPSLSSSVEKSGETQEIHRHVFQFLNSLSHCARSEHFTVSCSMHNN